MPLHDWTRVEAGIFHDFHTAWIAETPLLLTRERYCMPSFWQDVLEGKIN